MTHPNAIRGPLPRVKPEACPRTRTPKASCSRCVHACPTGAVRLAPGPEIEAPLCTGCAGCAAACPTGAIAVTHRQLALTGRKLQLQCYQVDPVSPWPCLLGLHWQTVAWALEQGLDEVAFVVGPCQQCVNASGKDPREHVRRLVHQVAEGLGVPEPAVVFEERQIPVTKPQAGVSRRALFAALAREDRVSLAWTGAFREGVSLPDVAVGKIIRTGPCFLCPVCVHACTAGALEVRENRLLFYGSRCNGCGACAEACGFSALQVLPEVARGESVLTVGGEAVCQECGEPFVGDAMVCPRCSFLKDRQCVGS